MDRLAVRPRCRHCGNELVTRPRGLGWKCFANPAIRAMYGPPAEATAKFAPKGEPTEAELEVMIRQQMDCLPDWWPTESERAARGEE